MTLDRKLNDGSKVSAWTDGPLWYVGIRYPESMIHTDCTGPFYTEAEAACEVTARAAMRAEMLDAS